MELVVNNKPQKLLSGNKLSELLLQLNMETRGIAVAVNNIVISKSDWNNYELNDKDKITIIKATQGG